MFHFRCNRISTGTSLHLLIFFFAVPSLLQISAATGQDKKTEEDFLEGLGISRNAAGELQATRPPSLHQSKPSHVPPAWNFENGEDKDCGLNALFMFLVLSGEDVQLDEVRRALKIGEDGASMQDLKEAAESLGVRVEVVKAPIDQLLSHHIPAIARLSGSGETQETQGHFVVVTNETDRGVSYLDGTSGMASSVAKAGFVAEYSGYAIIAKTSIFSAAGLGSLNFALVIVIFLEASLWGWMFAQGRAGKDSVDTVTSDS